jgi:hypothetical protein
MRYRRTGSRKVCGKRQPGMRAKNQPTCITSEGWASLEIWLKQLGTKVTAMKLLDFND